MRNVLLIGALISMAFVSNAFSGTMGHAYAVASFERVSDDRAQVVLRADDRSSDPAVSPCREIAATIAYRPEFFLRRTWSRGVTRADHREAIAALEDAAQAGRTVQFGLFGALAPDSTGLCVVELRGLAVSADNQFAGFNRPI